jgi:hypothetical protein
MKCIIENHLVLSQPPEGPIAAQIGSFAKSMSEQGYSLVSIHRHVFSLHALADGLNQTAQDLLRSSCTIFAISRFTGATLPRRCCCPQASYRLLAQGWSDPRRKENWMPTYSG